MHSPTLTLSLSLLTLTLTPITTAQPQTFEDYIKDLLPSCLVDCAITATETNTTCGTGSVSSTDETDISCLCDAFMSDDTNDAAVFAESLSRCIVTSDCEDSDIEELGDLAVDAEGVLRGAEGLCGDLDGDGEVEGEGGDSDGDDGDNGASTLGLLSGPNALVAAGALIGLHILF